MDECDYCHDPSVLYYAYHDYWTQKTCEVCEIKYPYEIHKISYEDYLIFKVMNS